VARGGGLVRVVDGCAAAAAEGARPGWGVLDLVERNDFLCKALWSLIKLGNWCLLRLRPIVKCFVQLGICFWFFA